MQTSHFKEGSQPCARFHLSCLTLLFNPMCITGVSRRLFKADFPRGKADASGLVNASWPHAAWGLSIKCCGVGCSSARAPERRGEAWAQLPGSGAGGPGAGAGPARVQRATSATYENQPGVPYPRAQLRRGGRGPTFAGHTFPFKCILYMKCPGSPLHVNNTCHQNLEIDLNIMA